MKIEMYPKKVMYPVTDSEMKDSIKRFGGFKSTDFTRISDNVAVVTNEAIVIAIKYEPTRVLTLHVINDFELPLSNYVWDYYEAKVWATPEIMENVKLAEKILLERLRNLK